MDDDNEDTVDYEENLVINKQVTIEAYVSDGSFPWVKAALVNRHVCEIQESGVVLRGIKLTGATGISNAGIVLKADNVTVSGNVVSGNQRAMEVNSCQNRITDNIIEQNDEVGILISNGCSNQVIGNTITGNAYGIQLKNAQDNVLYRNSFSSNEIANAISEDSNSSWNSLEPIAYDYNGETYTNYVGNKWDDYAGQDQDNDGLGDVAYPIDYGAQDEHPLVPEQEFGDANGDGIVDGNDLIYIRKVILGLEIEEPLADINKDEEVDGKDLILIKKTIIGLKVSHVENMNGVE
ncbi:MAG: NosD domain-containing protein [Chloroflexota bacterium]|nr:NosD domain-containing protein [Chloroflexota bacterium]